MSIRAWHDQLHQSTVEMNDYRALKELLSSWRLPQLYQYFKDEGINIEELEMMKSHHIHELLGNFKMGVRIRFEHKLDAWRRDGNKPLPTRESATRYVYGSTTITSKSTATATPTGIAAESKSKQNAATNTDVPEKIDAETNTGAVLSSPASAQARPPMSPSTLTVINRELPKLTPQPKVRKLERSLSPSIQLISPPPAGAPAIGDMNSVPVTILADPMPPSEYDHTADEPYEQAERVPSTLMQILQSSGPKGTDLIEYYQKHQELSHTNRTLLIHLIVNFFEANNYHLSLNMSHNLEREILQMFPSERLENYRTEKRGKIYVKFCNMKRYKRDRPGQKRKLNCNSSQSGSAGLSDNGKDIEIIDGNTADCEEIEDLLPADEDDYGTHFDAGWAKPKSSMVEIKTESEEWF